MARKYFCIQPEYVAKFVCDGKACDALCCGGWHIILDEEARQRFADSPLKEKIFAHIAFNDEADIYELMPDGRHCHFLDGDKLCSLQRRFGAGFLSDVCAEYPRKTHLFSKGIITRALCPTCPSAAELILTNKESMKFTQVEIESDRENYFQKVDAADNTELFFKLQKNCIDILQNHAYSINERMKKLGEYLTELDGGENTAFASKKTGDRLLYAEKMLKFLTEEAKDDEEQTADFLNAVKVAFAGENTYQQADAAYAAYEEKYLRPYGCMIENYLVNEFFIEMYPCAMPGSFGRNFLVFDALFSLMELFLAASAVKAASEDAPKDIVSAARWLSVRTNHFLGYTDLIGNFAETPHK